MYLALLLAVCFTEPAPIVGRVVSVADGDTITVLDADKVQHKIRLAGIDAPEKKQAFGTKSKEALAEKVHRKDVQVVWTKKDKYGRVIGDVQIDGRDVNREMVSEGWAWHYRQFSKSKELQAAEDEARKAKRGLWAGETPTPPWEFRRQKTVPADRTQYTRPVFRSLARRA